MKLFKKKEEDKPINRRRNLILLTIISIVVPLATTSASIFIYRATGDIYLDRSRPGYIEEGEKHDETDDGKEQFSNEGKIDKAALDEYLEQLKIVEDRLEESSSDFDAKALSDQALGIEVK